MEDQPWPPPVSPPLPAAQPLARSRRPRRSLHWTASDGTEVAISLRCKTKVFRELENLNDLGAFFRFLDAIGDEKTAAQVDELDILDTTTLVEEWGDALAERVSRAIGQPVTAGE